MIDKIHSLKTWPEPFKAIWIGEKTADFRKFDRDFRVEDHLQLREYDPISNAFSERYIEVRITHITTGFGIPEGYCMLSFKKSFNSSFPKRQT